MRYILHVYPEDLAFVDGDGRKYPLPTGEPVAIESDFIAGKIIEHLDRYGVVEVNQTKTKTGIQFDTKEAIKRAEDALDAAESAIVDEYVKTQLEDRIRKNFPAVPPQGRALEVIQKRNIDLARDYNIHPVGFDKSHEPGKPDERMVALEAQNAEILKQNAVLAKNLKVLQDNFDALTK